MKQDDFEIIWHRVKKLTCWERQNDLGSFLGIESAGISKAKKIGIFREKWAEKIAERYNTTADYILYGDKTENPPTPEQQPATPTGYDSFSIADKIQKTVRVLESDTIYRPALAANIDAFHHAVEQDKTVKNQQATIEAQQKQINDLAARMAVLEKHLSSVTATPGDYSTNPKTNNNGAA
jgi:hypothetical protein